MAQQTFDIIIAGGGTAGCVIAGRLAAADPTLSILVVEAGPITENDDLHTQPARYMHHLRPETTTVKFHVGRESAALGGRAPVVTCGQCLGGGSSVNFAVYARAAASDFDDWATVYGNRGWSCSDLLPLLRKCETYTIASGKPTHGYSGPLKISHGGFFTEVGKEFLDVGADYDKSRGSSDDINGLYECNKYGRWQKWIDPKTGRRSDVPHHYIYNQNLPNLHIVSGHHVKRVIFSNYRAVGIEYLPNKRFHPTSKDEVITATARRLVVVSAGPLGSPAILERSGIGSTAILEKVGVQPLVDLPGVGENYQDHQVMFAPYVAAKEAHTLDGIFRNDEAEIQKWSKEWKERGTGMMAQNGIGDGGIKLRPFKKDLDLIGDAFRQRWIEFYAPAPDKPVLWFGTVASYMRDRANATTEKSYSIAWYPMYPTSVGYLHITSADNVEAPLDFHPGYLDRPEDMALHKWGYKLSREYARRMPSYRGEIVEGHPSFSPSSKARAREGGGPVPISTPDIEYSEEDERAIEDYIRQDVNTSWHSLGTCAMKSRAEGGVVDSRLNVHGVHGLKVADLAICPGNVGANTYSTAVVIGEKAAVLIAEDLGIPIDHGPGADFASRL